MGADNITTEEIDDTADKEEVEEISISKADYDKLMSDSENYKASSKEAQKLAAFAEVHKDNTKFYKYYDVDKSKASYIAEQYGFDSADALKSHLDDYYKNHPEEKVAYSEDELMEKFEAKQEEKEAKKALNSFFKEQDTTKDSKVGKAILDEFNDLMEGKKRTVDNVEKYAQKALNIVKSTGKFAEDLYKTKAKLAGAASASIGGRKMTLDKTSSSALQAYKSRNPGSIFDAIKNK